MKIEIKHRDVWGNTLIYVCNPAIAHSISTLTGKKTIDHKDIKALQELGHEVVDLDQVLRDMFADVGLMK